MTSDNLLIKQIESKNEIDASISFLNKVSVHQMNRKIWDWQITANHQQSVLTILKDTISHTVKGTQFMLPIVLIVNNNAALTGKSENSHIDADLRGKGLFEKLYGLAVTCSRNAKMDFLWGFSPAVKVFENKLGFTVFQESVYTYSAFVGKPPSGPIQFTQISFYKSSLKYAYFYLNYLKFKSKCIATDFKTRYSISIQKYSIRDSQVSSGDVEQLYINLKSVYDDFIHLKMDKSYLDWRITANFNLNYITKYFYKNGLLEGYYIVSIKQTTAYISDFTSSGEVHSYLMLSHLLKEVSKFGISHLNYIGNIENKLNQMNFSLFQKSGGKVELTREMSFVYKNISDFYSDTSKFKLSKNWYLNGLWTQGFTY